MNKDNRNICKEQLAPGLWVDANGQLHVSVPDLLKALELEDTPDNREMAQQTLIEAVKLHVPDAQFIYRATPQDEGTEIK